ncbi:secreted RxLR effector protein 161-like [Castanea sativa]|uniref:secreted RxLR effector protein 161-like n=1 Tax=Castanea sativa TaxID=21020 RepID=UPI003F64E4A5
MIGSLLYLTASRPDISYSVGVCARYQVNPKKSYMTALKRIIKYVKTTVDFDVWYSKDINDVLSGYSDTDWAGNADDRKSTSGNSISLSTVEAEYIVAGSCCTQLLWMQKLLHDLVFVKIISPSIVTIPVASTSLRIRFNILELNT